MVFPSMLDEKVKTVKIGKKFEEIFSRTRGVKKWYLFVRKNGDSIVLEKTPTALTFEQSKYWQDHIGRRMQMVEVFTSDTEEDIQKMMEKVKNKYECNGVCVFEL